VSLDYRRAGRHSFGLLGEPCAKCGMTREEFEEADEPECEGRQDNDTSSARTDAKTRSKSVTTTRREQTTRPADRTRTKR
jgi:hypothetical protein